MSGRSLKFSFSLAVVTLLAFLPVWGNQFVNYDDDLYIKGVPEIAAGLDSDGVVWAVTTTQGANWFPLTRLSWMLDAELWGLSPRAFHATSLLLHVIASLVLLVAFERLTGDLGASAFLAGVFALHPLHVESVAWASARKDVLSGLFFALSLLAHERVARRKKPLLWGVLLFTFAGLGLASKPMLVTLPFVLLLLDLWPLGRLRRDGRWRKDDIRRAVVEKLPLFALVAVMSIVTVYAQREGGAVQTLDIYPVWARVTNAIDSILWYGVDAVWPQGLSAFYPYPHRGVPYWRLGLGVVLLVAGSVLAVRQIDRRPYLLVGLAWFVGMLIPVLGLVQVGQAARADRYMYLPLIGLSIPVIWGALELARGRPRRERALMPLGLTVLLVLASTTLVQAQVWRTSQTLFRHALRVTDRNHVAHANFGLALQRDGEPERADRQLSRAISVMPSSAHAYGLRGEIRLDLGRHADSAEDFRTARRLDPGNARWISGQGRAMAKQFGAEKSLPLLRRAIELEPEDPLLRAHLGVALLDSGDIEGAIRNLRLTLERPIEVELRLGPAGLALLHGHLGTALARAGKIEPALAEMEESLELDPENAIVWRERGALLERSGRTQEAVSAYREAVRRGERSAPILNNLAWILVSSKEEGVRAPADAVQFAEEAVTLTNRLDPSVLDTWSVALAAVGQAEKGRLIALEALALAEERGETELAASIRTRMRLPPGS